MRRSLEGKVAFVTGGSRGIGEAIVRRLVAEGAAVAFTFVSSRARVEEIVTELTRADHRVLAIEANNADAIAVRSAIDRAAAELGKIDVLVTNAGMMAFGAVDTLPLDDFDRAVAVNVRATFVAVQAAVPHMPPGSRIVTIGSNTAEQAMMAGSAVYGMTKAAVARLVRGLAHDLAPRGITAVNVQPGPTATDMNPKDGPHIEFILAKSPVHRIAEPREIADFVVWLARPEASYVNGASLTIDGGFTA
jgi:3-oxoacyl-[acyl-carrier protein] reductase